MLVVVAVLITLPVFWLAGETLLREWMTAEYSHGPAIVVLAIYLFLRAVHTLPSRGREEDPVWPGAVVLVFGLMLGVLGTAARVGDIAAYGLIFWIGGMVLLLAGGWRGRHLLIPVALLVFMLPLPQVLYWKLTIWLQLVSSQIGVWVIAQAGVPVYLEGNVIDLGVYQLQVAEACSGLRYLIPVMSLGIVLALLYNGPSAHRWLLVLAAGPITVLLNAIRIGIVGIAVDRFGIAQAEGLIHLFEGWVIFASCIGLLLVVAWLLFMTIPRADRPAHMLMIETAGLGSAAARFAELPDSRRLLGVIAAGVIASALAVAVQSKPLGQIARQPFVLFPVDLGDWQGVRRGLEPGIAGVLGADDTLDITYRAAQAAAPVNLFVAWYRDQADGSAIHSPEVCLPVNGWEVASLDHHSLSFPDSAYGTFAVNRAVIQNGLQRQLVYYWFEQRGRRMTNDVAAKLVVIYDGIIRGRTDGALVRYVTDIAEGETEAEADARLTGLVSESIALLPPFVPF
ncbi:VPLPA-CTERM-specific exosortase XrtD [Loktanella agnita]|uniref:VPLPA-CTERM-specific exosortase XrtD n=1 Tax=Loktanella agnita TaxID=287097 RepID=UPI0039857BAE